MDYYTADQVVRMLNVNPRTLHKWMAALEMQFDVPAHDKRIRRLTAEQVEQLAAFAERPMQSLLSERELVQLVVDLRAENADLRAQLADAQQRLERGASVSSVAVGRPRARTSYGMPLPDGWVPAIPFLLEHLRCSETTARRRVLQLAHQAGDWAGGVRYAFDEEQQRQVVELTQ